MNRIGKAIDRARAKVDKRAYKILPDLCDIEEIGLVSDGHSGQTTGPIPIATDIPCEVIGALPSGTQIVAGGVTYTATHRLKFTWNAITAGINPKQIITVRSQGLESEMVFEQPVRERGSKSIWLYVLAKLTTGYRSPANV